MSTSPPDIRRFPSSELRTGGTVGLAFRSATDLASLIRSGQLSARELLEVYIERIERLNGPLNAVVTLDLEQARRSAKEADEAIAQGESCGPLHGVPFTLKDTHATSGVRTTAGYPPLGEYVPASDGTIASRLKAAGAILLGKTNTALLAYDQQTTNPIFGRTNNPWDLSRTPSGSSGGAAAAIAAGLTAFDIGSDAGGSIRVPAHFCGIYGLKPTFGLVSQVGHIPDLPGRERLDWVLATSGPLARSASDLGLTLRVIAGPDQEDSTVAPVVLTDVGQIDPASLKLAWARTLPGSPVSLEVSSSIERLAALAASLGARVEEVVPPIDFDELWDTYQTLANLSWRLRARLHHIAEIDDGGAVPSLEEVAGAMAQRERLIARWERFLTNWDAFLCPPCMTTAYPHTDRGNAIMVDDYAARYDDECRYCYPFNVTGHPALVAPIGLSTTGLPIGAQLVAARWSDFRLIAIADALSTAIRPFLPPPGFQ